MLATSIKILPFYSITQIRLCLFIVIPFWYINSSWCWRLPASQQSISRNGISCVGQITCIVVPELIPSSWVKPNHSFVIFLTHWSRVTHICVSNLTIIGSDNGLSPGPRQAIIWTNDGLLLIEPFGTYFIEIWIKIQFSLMKIHLKKSGKCWPSCLGLNMLKQFSMFHRCSQVLYKSFEKCELCQVVLYGILN